MKENCDTNYTKLSTRTHDVLGLCTTSDTSLLLNSN